MYKSTEQQECDINSIKIWRKLQDTLPADSHYRKFIPSYPGLELLLLWTEKIPSLFDLDGNSLGPIPSSPQLDSNDATAMQAFSNVVSLFSWYLEFFYRHYDHILLRRVPGLISHRVQKTGRSIEFMKEWFGLATHTKRNASAKDAYEEALELAKMAQAVCATLETVPRARGALAFVAMVLEGLYNLTGDKSHLQEAMKLFKRNIIIGAHSLQLGQQRDKDRWRYLRAPLELWTLFKLHQHRCSVSSDPPKPEEIEEVIELCKVILTDSSNANWDLLIEVGAFCVQLYARQQRWDEAYETAQKVANLVPQLYMQSADNTDDILFHTMRLAKVVPDAIAVALRARKSEDLVDALSLFEQCRTVISTAAEQLRADVRRLREAHPDLADRFVKLRHEVKKLRYAEAVGEISIDDIVTRKETEQELKTEFEDVLSRIKGIIPEFHESSLPLFGDKDFRKAASRGFVVVVNVSEFGCHAILIETQQIRIVALEGLSMKDIELRETEGELSAYDTLEWLWTVVAHPVLDALGFHTTFPATTDDGAGHTIPHLWRIPTGPLIKFPLHAAGLHRKQSGETVWTESCHPMLHLSDHSFKSVNDRSGTPNHAAPTLNQTALRVKHSLSPWSTPQAWLLWSMLLKNLTKFLGSALPWAYEPSSPTAARKV